MKRTSAIAWIMSTCILWRNVAPTLLPDQRETTQQQEGKQEDVVLHQHQQQQQHLRRSLMIDTTTLSTQSSTTTATDDDDRPIMYTYFTPLSPSQEGSTVTAGMSESAHDLMLTVWQEAWQQAGWKTRILTIGDAKQHAEFNEFHNQIQTFKTNDYNQACYYRWLAMAAVGGGWMSDYDVLPLHNFTQDGVTLPRKGVFTCYARHVPCLLSGTANEWYRMTKRLVEYASRNLESNGGGTPSDMLALLALKEKYPYMLVTTNQIAPHKAFLIDQQWNPQRCDTRVPVTKARAIHFSHNTLTHIWIAHHPDDTMDDRPAIAKKWLETWLTQCGRQTFQDDNRS